MIASTMPSRSEKAPRASVLVVDDEPTIREVVARYLERAGYSARVAGDGAQALALAAQSTPDLIVLDLMLPAIDGLQVLRRLRESEPGSGVRVIVLTARGRESERIVGLKDGADDYVVKPFSPNELVARVEAVLRRGRVEHTSEQLALQFGELCIDPTARTVTVGDREVGLTAREFDLLLFLAQHPGQVFSRDRLMEIVWGLQEYGDSSTVTVHVRRLRAKLESDAERPRHIQTVWGVGYRFRA
jgi:DNA-binding response OmpR family regulator